MSITALLFRWREDRYAFRADQNLPDKEFRYLRTVIVTAAAVHRGFGSRLHVDRPWLAMQPRPALGIDRRSIFAHRGFTSYQIASSVFTLGTAAVLPFYTFMVLAPKSKLLPGIAKMFSNKMTLASAWIHLLAVDLFAARQVFCDGLKNEIETRHSVSLCLLFCPIGIVTHVITKVLTKRARNIKHSL
ncbi:hypothetical protein HHK36_006941 [Tetracentron sinense]|uniref:Uncharacterized protein n=1 Tax=Tetracentron sinense TaxID=13715 RepID=A0A834ZLL0_TETSI|nr:hypothetical protein HHK36_006941 [Tetracentron sinense]